MRLRIAKTDDATPSSCRGELLYNGICLPEHWPPHINLTATPTVPPYLRASCSAGDPGCRPNVIQIAGARQLFVDEFLIEEVHGLSRTFHAATIDPQPVLSPTEPWESQSHNPAANANGSEVQYARAFSGGVSSKPDVAALLCLRALYSLSDVVAHRRGMIRGRAWRRGNASSSTTSAAWTMACVWRSALTEYPSPNRSCGQMVATWWSRCRMTARQFTCCSTSPILPSAFR